MCLIGFALNAHPKYPLLVMANRDEFYARPTAPVGWWKDHQNIVGGRDLKDKGTWMAFGKNGRFAALTNYRDLKNIRENAPSRGELPVKFISSQKSATEFFKDQCEDRGLYNGFNLLGFENGKMYHISNYSDKIISVPDGVHGLSNALLDTPWPKVVQIKSQLQEALKKDINLDELMGILESTSLAEDNTLPNTGVPIEWERQLSAMHIRTENYGTCSASVLAMDREGKVTFLEKTYPVGDRSANTTTIEFEIDK